MCHIALIRYLCAHRNLFQLHCDQGSSLLCPQGKRELVGRYRIGYVCVDCFNVEWDNQTDARLSKIDDALASLASKCKPHGTDTDGGLPPSLRSSLSQQMALRDAAQEKEALAHRDRQVSLINFCVKLVKAHAMVLFTCRFYDDNNKGNASVKEKWVEDYKRLKKEAGERREMIAEGGGGGVFGRRVSVGVGMAASDRDAGGGGIKGVIQTRNKSKNANGNGNGKENDGKVIKCKKEKRSRRRRRFSMSLPEGLVGK
ncbi:hypothetical protein QBC43DRAFT_289745 [Cladorrhinum sp. PSN259]|nr:hypothetical protein QBC43DRAFT_289745 [Cladorrhinum sp. PSN259]